MERSKERHPRQHSLQRPDFLSLALCPAPSPAIFWVSSFLYSAFYYTPPPLEAKIPTDTLNTFPAPVLRISRELQESLGPSGPEIPKKSGKSLPGPPAPGPQKVWKKSRTDIFETFSRLFGLFRDFFQTFWGPGAGGPGRLFPDFFGISGPEGLRDSCSSREGSQHQWCIRFLGPREKDFYTPLALRLIILQ